MSCMRAARRLRLIIMAQQQLLLFVTCVRPVIVSCRWCPDVTSSHRVIASAWAICVTVFVRLRQSSVFRRPSSCDRSCLRACTPSPFLSSRVLACACPPLRASRFNSITHHTYRTHSVYMSSPFRNWFLHIPWIFFSSHNPFGLWTLFFLSPYLCTCIC